MVKIEVRHNESIEDALKRFNRAVNSSRVLATHKKKQTFVSAREEKRLRDVQSKARIEKKKRRTMNAIQFMDTHKFPPKKDEKNRNKVDTLKVKRYYPDDF